ncbi:MAG: cyclic nucleotide-binding domain-containing protein [Verrucomicrobiota bacterium]
MHALTTKRLRLSPAIEVRDLPDGTRLLKQLVLTEYLALDAGQQRTLALFDGQKTVEEVLHDLLRQGAHPNIRAFYDLVLNALNKGFLEEADATDVTAPEISAVGESRGGSMAFSGVLILAGAAALWHSEFAPGERLEDWFKVLVFMSAGLSLAYALAASTLSRFGRQVYGARVRWDRLVPFFTIDVRDAFMGGRACEAAVGLRTLSGPFVVAALSWLADSNAGMLAAAFTALVLGSPFGSTPAHSLLHALFRKRYELPHCADEFLGKRLISQLLDWKRRVSEENYYLLHATYSILWLGTLFRLANSLMVAVGEQVVRTLSEARPPDDLAVSYIVFGLLGFGLAAIVVYALFLVVRGVQRHIATRLATTETRSLRNADAGARPTDDAAFEFLRQNLLFSQLKPEDLRSVVQAMKFLSVPADTMIIREHEPGDTMFVVYSGSVGVTKEDDAGLPVDVATLGRGDIFGEIALLEKGERTSSVRAREAASLFVLAKPEFDRLLASNLGSAAIKTAVQVCAFLRRRPLFADWHPQALMKLAGEFSFVDCKAGEVVIREGEPNDAFYIVYEGQFGVRKQGVTSATLKPGDFCGEISLLRDIPATADVLATHPSRALRLARASFLQLVSHDFFTGLAIDDALRARAGGKGAA